MQKKFGLLNTMFEGLLIFMLLSLSNVHAATLDWGNADDTLFYYSASIDCIVDPPWNEIAVGEIYQDLGGSSTPVGSIDLIANASTTPLSDVILSAQAFGGIIPNGASSSAFVSFDIGSDIDGTNIGLHIGDDSLGDTYGGDAKSWVKRQGLSVDAPGLFDLHGIFSGSINFNTNTSEKVYENAIYNNGGILLEERIENEDGTASFLSQTWTLTIEEIKAGTTKEVRLDNETDDMEAIHYDLLVGFTGTGIQADLSNWKGYGDISATSNYELGNLEDPLSLNGYLTAQVPLPGTLMLFFSGIAGLFGFKLSLLRRGSSNN